MEGGGPLIASLRRLGGRVPPADNEHLDVAPDGGFRMWRSANTAVAGRFAGSLDGAELAALVEEARAAAAAGDLEAQAFPDDAIERVEVGGARAVMGGASRLEGPWAALVAHLHRLLDELTDRPLAALALQLDRGGRRAWLVHRGSQPLRLELSKLSARAVLWGPNWWLLEDWRSGEAALPGGAAPAGSADTVSEAAPGGAAEGAGSEVVVAGPGWSLELPFGHGFEPGPDRTIQAFAELVVIERDLPVQVGLVATSPFTGAD
jgi:hypothetical protein